jgi:hypothetical protein
MIPIEIFTWGYWGWGNHTSDLVKGVDAVEAKRGFAPPLFIDIRISRSVRAKGFSGTAFEKLLGSQRYHHLPDLGNDTVLSGGTGIKIHNPAAVADLLDQAFEAGRQNRRTLVFCACEFPKECHRRVAGGLLLEEARKRGISVVLDEWPGGEPKELTVPIPLALLKQVRNGRKSIALPKDLHIAEWAGLPWGSAVEVRSGDASAWVVSGPAKASAGSWWLPVFSDAVFDSAAAALEAGQVLRWKHGFGRQGG